MSLSLVPIFADADGVVEGGPIVPFGPHPIYPFDACTQPSGLCPSNNANAVNPRMVFSAPCCPAMNGEDVLGVGTNDKILQYQFNSFANPSYCGVSLDNQCNVPLGTPFQQDCAKCPCQEMGCASFGKNNGCCDYFGAARNHASIMGPSGGNRYLNQRWG